MAADEQNPENAEQPGAEETSAEETSAEQMPAEETSAEDAGAEGAGSDAEDAHAVPSEDAKEIAAEVEDAPLEALQEAQQSTSAGHAATPATVEPGGEGHAVPSEDAMEIAAVAEDAPLEAAQEAQDTAAEEAAASEEEEDAEPTPRVRPSVPGAHLEVDIVPEGVDPLGRGEDYEDPYAVEEDEALDDAAQDVDEELEEVLVEPIATAAIDLASGARYRATGKRKTAIARVTLRPGTGSYLINGRPLEMHFPRLTLQRNIRQPLETVGYHERMDVVARLHGGGISAQAGALRHGVSRALLEADPNLRGELKRRGFLTRDSRAKERKKAGLKKARKRPQFSKR